MAKNKIKTIEEEIRAKYGNILVSGDFVNESQGRFIPTTLSLDIALRGGILEGTTTNIGGVTGSGKTTLCLQIISNAQKMGKECFYVDIECRLTPQLMSCIAGLDQSKIQIIRPTIEQFLTAENYLNIVVSLIKSKPGSVVVVDSVAALCSEGLAGINLGESKRMADIPTLMYGFFRQVQQIVAGNKANLINITHLQANPGGYTGPVAVGGNAMQFFASTTLRCTSSPETPKDGEKTGRSSTFKILKSAVGPPAETSFPILYGSGYDYFQDLFNVAESMGAIDRSGAWYTIKMGETESAPIQGQEGVINMLKSDKEMTQKLDTYIREMALSKGKK